MTNKKEYADEILKSLFREVQPSQRESLKEIFERRLLELKLSVTSVLELLSMEQRSLNGILDGSQKRVDFTNLLKIANFLQISKDQIVRLYLDSLEKTFPEHGISSAQNIEFIKENFDLAVLKKAGFIKSITDFNEIEKSIVTFLGLNSILDYNKPNVDVAFSTGLVKPKNDLSRSFWIKAATDYFLEVNNPNDYDRKELINYFPNIRWHSTDVEIGLINVIRDLYKLGVTVVYQPQLPTLHLRGATFSVNDKPCVALSNYVGFYPTMWFALVHELFHVLFDWEEIRKNQYHLSDDEVDILTVREKEKEANEFSREFLFSKEKTAQVKPFMNNLEYVSEFALNNHVHPSFPYVFYASDTGNKNRYAWSRARKYNPSMEVLLKQLENPWENPKPISEFVKSVKYELYK